MTSSLNSISSAYLAQPLIYSLLVIADNNCTGDIVDTGYLLT